MSYAGDVYIDYLDLTAESGRSPLDRFTIGVAAVSAWTEGVRQVLKGQVRDFRAEMGERLLDLERRFEASQDTWADRTLQMMEDRLG